MAATNFSSAIEQAIREEMHRDESVIMLGESIRRGVYGVTGSLTETFGDRIIDTPLSENGFIGAAVGAAAVGMRPVVTLMASFMWVAMDQLVSQAAKMRYMFGGQVKLPIVFRLSLVYGNALAAHHSDRPHSMYMNMPGLKLVMPTTPADAKGLLKTAIREDDPVIFFEDNNLSGARGEVVRSGALGEVPEEEYTTPFGVADVKREGSDVTVVALAGMNRPALAAAENLAEEGIDVEVVDPRTIVPLDRKTILESVAKTGRLVVVDPAHLSCSVASEIAAIVAQEGFWSLQAPIQRVASLDCHFPFSPALEPLVFPNEGDIADAIRATLE
jgi:pyruvate dehydrogenase E1 component beta subunit